MRPYRPPRTTTPPISRIAIRFAILTTVFILGWWLPYKSIPSGVYNFPAGPKQTVAGEAFMTYYLVYGNPLSRLAVPAVRVVAVQRAPDECTMRGGPHGSALSLSDYSADIRLHGPFGIPVGTMRATCGGSQIAFKR